MQVKICGITNLEDALVAVEAGADALGFVFYEKSPRKMHPENVREIVSGVPMDVEKVGVFVGAPPNKRIVYQARLTAIQIHPTSPAMSRQQLHELGLLPEKVFYAISEKQLLNSRMGGFGWRTEAKNAIRALLLDSRNDEQPGGTGVTFDWMKAAPIVSELREQFSFVVAGGLTPENVTGAMSILQPWGVDVSSGVESRPGKKDPDKVRAFIKAVRDHDQENSRN